MRRRTPDLATALAAYWAARFPLRPPKVAFSDETLVLADFLWAQLDPNGTRPIILPPMAAKGAESQPSVRASTRRSGRSE